MGYTLDELITHREGIVTLAASTVDRNPGNEAHREWLDRQIALLDALKRLKTLDPKET